MKFRIGSVITPDEALPREYERWLARCAQCGERFPAFNQRWARRKLNSHFEKTGHCIGSIFGRMRSVKEE